MRVTPHWRDAGELVARSPGPDVDPMVLSSTTARSSPAPARSRAWTRCCTSCAASGAPPPRTPWPARWCVPPHRDGGRAQHIDAPVARCEDDLLGAILAWASAHLAEEISVETLARRALTSPRTFARRFTATTGRRRTPGCSSSGATLPRRCWRRPTPRSRRSRGWSGAARRPDCGSSSPAAGGCPRARTARPSGRRRAQPQGRRRSSSTGTGRGLAGWGATSPWSSRDSVSRRSSA